MDNCDIFISFSSFDRNAVSSLVSDLRNRNLNVWWSEDIEYGRWDTKILEQLEKAKFVLGIVTPQIEKSTRDYIFYEFDYARSKNKLIPIVVGEGSTAFHIRGIISLLQCYFFDDFKSIAGSPKFDKLIRVCGGDAAKKKDSDEFSITTPIKKVDDWYTKIETKYGSDGRKTIFSIALSVAVFEYTSPSRVRQLAKYFKDLITNGEMQSISPDEIKAPERLTPLLTEAACNVTENRKSHGIREDKIVFNDPEMASAMLEFTWTEFGDYRDPLSRWLGDIVANGSGDEVLCVGFSLGILAQRYFSDVFDNLLVTWIFSDSPRRRLTADVALSVAAHEPSVAKLIKELLENWSTNSNVNSAKAVLRLASGYTAMRLPETAVEVIRKVADQKDVSLRMEVFDEIRTSIVSLLRHSAIAQNSQENKEREASDETNENDKKYSIANDQSDNSASYNSGVRDDSLIDLSGLISKLADWALERSSGEKDRRVWSRADNPYPLAVVLFVLDELQLVSPKHVSYAVSWKRLLDNEKTADDTIEILTRAMERHRVGFFEARKTVKKLIRTRVSILAKRLRDKTQEQKEEDPRYQTLLKLACLLSLKAQDQIDQDRINFLFKPLFSQIELDKQLGELRNNQEVGEECQ